MCSPKVISQVQQTLSRRSLLKLGAGAVAAGALPLTSARAQPVGMRFNNIQDLTHTLSPSFPVFPAFEPMKITKQYDVAEDGFYANRWIWANIRARTWTPPPTLSPGHPPPTR